MSQQKALKRYTGDILAADLRSATHLRIFLLRLAADPAALKAFRVLDVNRRRMTRNVDNMIAVLRNRREHPFTFVLSLN
jgi:hypothetical protein